MIHRSAYLVVLLVAFGYSAIAFGHKTHNSKDKGWISLFNGKNLDGWKVGKNASTFSVEDGMIKVAGSTAHLFYQGNVQNHNFKNFEFKAQVMTKPGSNSGIYIHTKYQEGGWPEYGYEVQVNNSHTDWKPDRKPLQYRGHKGKLCQGQ